MGILMVEPGRRTQSATTRRGTVLGMGKLGVEDGGDISRRLIPSTTTSTLSFWSAGLCSCCCCFFYIVFHSVLLLLLLSLFLWYRAFPRTIATFFMVVVSSGKNYYSRTTSHLRGSLSIIVRALATKKKLSYTIPTSSTTLISHELAIIYILYSHISS